MNQHEPATVTMPRPVNTSERIQTIDFIRGFALLGILLMNIPGFGIDGSAFNKIISGSHKSADFITLGVITTFFDGTMRGLFSMLFGAGMILFTLNKKENTSGVTVAEYYYRRLLWLVLFGVFNAYILLWFGDILFYYGLCGMLLYPFRNTKPKWLLIIGITCIGIGLIKGIISWSGLREKRAAYTEAVAAKKAQHKLTEKQQQAITTWQEIEKSTKPDTDRSNKNISKMRSGYSTVFTHLLPTNAEEETFGMYYGAWDMISMMFIGMALFGFGFFSNKLSTSTYVIWLMMGYGLGIPFGLIFFKAWPESLDIGRFVDRFRLHAGYLYHFRRLFLSIGHASLLMLVYRSRLVPWLMKALANVGQMAFTNYLMQSIICTLFFYGYGLGYFNKLHYYQLYYIVGAVWIFQIIFSSIWLRYFLFGPFEWLWRSLTYWKKQPMRLNTV